MQTQKQSHWTEKKAREVLERAKENGQSLAALAREMGISPCRLYWWRRRLRAVDRPSDRPSFIEVKVSPEQPSRPFEVRTSNGRGIGVWPGFDAEELERLISVAVEEGLYISLHDPFDSLTKHHSIQGTDRIVRAASGPESIRARQKVRFVDGS